MSYSILFHAEAKRELDKLDGRQKIIVLKQIKKLKSNPYSGEELGNKAGMDLSGYRKLYADNKKIRVVYKIIENEILVFIIAIGRRDKSEVYGKAAKRTK